jgi:hypothetical protein
MVASRRWVAVVVAVALAAVAASGCAEGVPGAAPGADEGDDVDGGDDGSPQPDAAERPDAGDDDEPVPDAGVPDAAPPPDAAPRTVTLSQNVSETVTGGAVACIGGGGLFTPRYLRENSWYRAFTLTEHGVDGTFEVARVDFSVYTALSGSFSGVQPLKVRLHTLSGGVLTTSALTQLASVDLEVEDGGLRALSVPITAAVPAGATLVAEVFVPDGVSSWDFLQLGANTDGERGPGYWRGPGCVTGVQAIHDATQAHEIVLTVTGLAP